MLDLSALLLRLALAAAGGGLIGYQRELKDRPAGFRTHIVVSLGSALFMIVSIASFPSSTDPTRIAAQVVTGIGFLGAGTIIRQGNMVTGLTTAASLWSVAAVGLASGAGYYSAAAVGALMIFVALSAFKMLEARIVTRKPEYKVAIVARPEENQFNILREMIGDGAEIYAIDIECETNKVAKYTFQIRLAEEAEIDHLANRIQLVEGVSNVGIEEAAEKATPLFS